MRILDIIEKKKQKQALTDAEIGFLIDNLSDLPDYQIAALLMAIRLNGLNTEESARLTLAMAYSGERLDLSPLRESGLVTADKHSTGGVGDKTTIAVAPIVSACGIYMPKMSGRGLGHTGGTIDKLESVPGVNLSLSLSDFFDITREAGFCIAGQTANLAPADKRLYAMRDVTATVDSIPLIAASVMSKKLAAGADNILLDVKTGSGAFMKTEEDAKTLAELMTDIGRKSGRNVSAIITDMSAPLGMAIGNSVEMIEAVAVLRGVAPSDITRLCVALAEGVLTITGIYNADGASAAVSEAIRSGAALSRLARFIELAGGDPAYITDTINNYSKFKKARYSADVTASAESFIAEIDTEAMGAAARLLGAGRLKADDEIDHAAGIIAIKKPGDKAEAGEPIAKLLTNNPSELGEASDIVRGAYKFSRQAVLKKPLIALSR